MDKRNIRSSWGEYKLMFTAHSTRAAVSLAMHDRVVAVQDIMKTAGWSNAETFARFYKKSIIKKKAYAWKINKGNYVTHFVTT